MLSRASFLFFLCERNSMTAVSTRTYLFNCMLNIPITTQKRIVIVGSGFAGLTLAQKLKYSGYQVVLIDKNNYHQFQPLLYQVATAGLEPRDISFPLRKIFQKFNNTFIRIAEVSKIDTQEKVVTTSLGTVHYDYLVLANGASTSFFGMKSVEEHSIPMKSVAEALVLLNSILHNFEDVLVASDHEVRESEMNIVVVGGGPTGVELSGALAEMKRYVFPKDYRELDCSKIRIVLVEAADQLLNGMSAASSKKAEKFLKKLGVEILLSTQVVDYDGQLVSFKSGESIRTKTLVWAAGIAANLLEGVPTSSVVRGRRLLCDSVNRLQNANDIFVLGDAAYISDERWPKGHPQVAQVAIQQARNLARNFVRLKKNQPLKPFRYSDYGSMATVGRNKAVVDLPFAHFQGLFAWILWMFIHLRSIFGLKNKIQIFINWVWSYLTYDQSLRLTFLPKDFRFRNKG